MKITRKISASLLGLCLVLAASPVRAQDVLIVANRSVTVSAVSSAQLHDIFVGTLARLIDGTRVIPVLLKGGPAHEVFLRHYIGDSPGEFRTRWQKITFSGQGAMPREFRTESELLQFISNTPGAIGYVSRAPEGDGVKVLNVTR